MNTLENDKRLAYVRTYQLKRVFFCIVALYIIDIVARCVKDNQTTVFNAASRELDEMVCY